MGRELTLLGRRILFVYGQNSIKTTGLHRRISELTRDGGIDLIDCGGIRPNPVISTVRGAVVTARNSRCEAILAVGGGSVIDSAKAIGAGVAAEHDVWKFFSGKRSVRDSLPLLSIPTVAGSGSEINHGMVLTHEEYGLKFGFAHRNLYPRVCIADPALTMSVPAEHISYGCVDGLCHCLEPYLTTTAAGIDFQRHFLENTATTIAAAARGCLEHPESLSHRSALLWGSMMAMSPLSVAGLGRVHHSLHVLEHGISALHDVPHGAGLGALLGGWLDCHLETYGEKISQWVGAVLGSTTVADTHDSRTAIETVRAFLRSLGCPVSLGEFGLSPSDLAPIAAHATAQLQVRKIPGLDERRINEILSRSL